MSKLEALQSDLRQRSQFIVPFIFDRLAPRLICVADGVDSEAMGPKDLNDPIWKIVRLSALEVALLDLPLFQRLRHVRQLGLAHLVYPTATHSRLDHSIGTMIAAKRMFDMILSNSDSMDAEKMAELQQITAFAALLHDSGHTAFSHCGESVLTSLFDSEFSAIQEVLDQFYGAKPKKNFGKDPKAPTYKEKRRPPSAELISVLFVLSPSMQKFVDKQHVRTPTDQFLLTAAALITGRGYELTKGRHEFSFVSSIISGDLDADKIDYVARDAYFSGVPISADVDRLISQLVAAPVTKATTLENTSVDFKDLGNKTQYILGIRRAGIPAFEMFVMTRSYLFERIYSHQKIRAAERAIERTLRAFLMVTKGPQSSRVFEMLDVLFVATGDDGVLHEMLANPSFCDLTNDILLRRLPRRGVAINQRVTKDFNADANGTPASIVIPYQQASEVAIDDPMSLEMDIKNRAKLGKSEYVIVDWPRFNPVSEDPKMYVWDSKEPNKLSKLSRYFNVQQLSNAYRDVKQIAWVFCAPPNRAKVGVTAALILQERFDLLLGPEAFHRAKLLDGEVEQILNSMPVDKGNSRAQRALDNLRSTFDECVMLPSKGYLGEVFSDLGADSGVVAGKVEKAFFNIPFYRAYSDDLTAALEVMGILIRHAKATNGRFRADKDKDPTDGAMTPEAIFQKSVMEFAQASESATAQFDVFEAAKSNGGFTDVIFRSKEEPSVEVVVELKSEQATYNTIVKNSAGQSTVYSADRFGRVSILYAQYKSTGAPTIAETIQVRKSAHSNTQIVFCLGQNAFGGIPSDRGKGTTEIS